MTLWGIPVSYTHLDVYNRQVLYYNPNISPKEEYEARVREQKRLIGEMDFTYPVSFLEGNYVPLLWLHTPLLEKY